MCPDYEPAKPLVTSVDSEKVVIAEHIEMLNMAETRSIPTPNYLPPDLSFFTGRQNDIAEVEAVLRNRGAVVAICSLWGMGGVGKSALAIHLAHRLHQQGEFKDGVLWANLGASTIDDVLVGFIRAFGLDEDQVPPYRDDRIGLLRSILQSKNVLMILDNILTEEQVLPFLVNEPTVSIVVTSRKQLLGLTEYSALIKDLDVFSPSDAISLLKKRLGARSDVEADATRMICELSGQLPLAISIAAARLSDAKRWPMLQRFVERLQEEHRRLDEFAGATKERDLRAVFSVSYDSLRDDQKRTFSLISLFGHRNFGSSGLVALLDTDKRSAIDQLEELVSLSLLLRSQLGGYHLHDLLFLFSEETFLSDLSESEGNVARARLVEYSLRVRQARALGSEATIQARNGNLDGAIELYVQAQEISLQIQLRNGQASSLGGLASAFAQKGELDRAIEYYEQAQLLNREIGNLAGQASALGGLASAFAQKGELDKAIAYNEQSLALSREIGNRAGQASALGGLASAFAQKGELDKAIEHYEQSIALSREIGNRAGQASSLGGLASAFAQKGELDKAIAYNEQSIALSREIGNRAGQASSLGGLASAFAQRGMWTEAVFYYEEALSLNREIGDLYGQARALGGLASIYAQSKNWLKVIHYQEEALTISEELDDNMGQEKAIGGIAFGYSHLGKLDKSIEYQLRALKINEKNNNPWGKAKAYGALAGAYQKQGESEKAIEYYLRAQEINQRTGDLKGQARALGGLGSIYFRQRSWEQAIDYLEQVLKLNRRMRDRFMYKTLYQLAISFRAIGDLPRARKYVEEAHQLSGGKDKYINRLFEELVSQSNSEARF
ncbi:MAG TPA: tetratricopeptide repeat protein [Pyrinomonadaceae bacterium]|nr:tetratricopeptide repeat protein [Pyrinomonadaceae bacterium]